ncbi:MAG: glycosyltransferase family 4 protein [Candidatus Andersenbacteria bacterium]|nr:glycosyltransferase family 4 protein [Candidatus Andersenbacteria bacterium]
MRILHVCLRYPPAIGGVETYAERLVKETRDITAGRDVRVLTSKLYSHSPLVELDPNLLLDDPMYVQRLHHAATPFISYPRLQALTYYLGHHRPDIIHGYSFWYQPADAAARYARRHDVSFILHPMFYRHGNRLKPTWELYRHTLGRATFAAASAVVVISPYEQRLIEQTHLPVKRCILIPPGIDSELLQQPQPNPFAARGIHGRIVITVSRLAPRKGLEEAISALPQVLRQHSDAQLAVIGPDFGVKDRLERQAQQVNIAAHVHFLGRLERNELIGAYQHADILLHPSHYEAFGISVAEALAAGTPVVARNVAAIPYVAPHEQAALLFNTRDEMVSHLVTLLTDTTLAARLAKAGQKRVQQEFTWPSAREKILRLYDEIT